MKRTLPPIYFYIPEDELPRNIPDRADDYWKWCVSLPGAKMNSGTLMNFGTLHWTLKTYLHLRDAGFKCGVVHGIPEEGIVLSHMDFLETASPPDDTVLLVCIKADRPPLARAQVHVVQNPFDRVEEKYHQLIESVFIPHWTQPSIIPRNRERGDRFRNIAYVGSSLELDDEFKTASWKERLKSLGLEWKMKTDISDWNDYGHVDAILAVRKCGAKIWDYKNKPATKLYNAWKAGVPAVLGAEAAYITERKSENDYLEADSPEKAIEALMRLKNDPDLRKRMQENARKRSAETRDEVIVEKWVNFLEKRATPAYYKWKNDPYLRRRYFVLSGMKKTVYNVRRAISGMLEIFPGIKFKLKEIWHGSS